ncbi:MAG: F-type H+-transporting ATPase subunit epsilon [Gaiellaceae bacterium]|nr:F-type H+-transporting ATPase subunit epsilon [Gaiellaceae bacterium]
MADETRKFDLSLVTPDGPAFEGEVEMIIVPGAAGEIGVLARHAPLIATLKAGSTRVYLDRGNNDVREFATGAGFFKVEQDRAIALVDDAVPAGEIDDARAKEQLETAQRELERVESGESNADRWQLEQRIKHAENQLSVSGRS